MSLVKYTCLVTLRLAETIKSNLYKCFISPTANVFTQKPPERVPLKEPAVKNIIAVYYKCNLFFFLYMSYKKQHLCLQSSVQFFTLKKKEKQNDL